MSFVSQKINKCDHIKDIFNYQIAILLKKKKPFKETKKMLPVPFAIFVLLILRSSATPADRNIS